MNQKGSAGEDVLQAGRDINYHQSSLLNVSLTSAEVRKKKSSFLSRLFNWLKAWWEKDRVIAQLRKQLYELQHSYISLKRELRKTKQGLEEVKKQVNRLVREGTENANFNDDLLEILQLLVQLNSDQKAAEHYEKAAFWITPRLSKWTEEAVKIVANESPEDISVENIEFFYRDLKAYMDWFQQSMILAHPIRSQLDELNQKRYIKQPQPYREATSYIFSKVSLLDVSEEEFQAIHQMASFLRKYL